MQETESTYNRWWNYLNYFLYLAWGWNIRLAWFVICREISGEKTLGHYSSGINTLKDSVAESDLEHASIYQPINFYTAERLFEQLEPESKRSAFLDAGCGMGRVIAMAAQKGFAKLYGFDISAKMVYEALIRTAYLQNRYHGSVCHISQENALYYTVPDQVGVIFLFNPFDEYIMQGFIDRVIESVRNDPRSMTILYANPVHKAYWIKAGFKEIHYFRKMTYLEGSVLHLESKKGA